MHKILAYVAFGWLTFGGIMHFLIDVLSQYLRHKRAPGPEATLYYGLNSAYALGQVLLGILGLVLARRALELLGEWPALTLCFAATAGWLAIGFWSMEYWQPKFMVGVFGALVVAMAVTR